LKIIFVGGGTAGHINPALALADYIKAKEPTCEILYVGAKGGMEEKLVPEDGFNFKGITVSGFSRKLSLSSVKKNIITLKNVFVSTFESKKILKEFKPDICVGTGGYVSGPFLRQAGKMKIPFIIHDSNSYPGVTTKLLAKKATKVLLINDEAKKHLPQSISAEITGTPVRKKIIGLSKNEAKKSLGLRNGYVILSFGGSLGASTINNVMAELITKHITDNNYSFIHGFGKRGHSFGETLTKNSIDIKNNPRYVIKEYIKNMPECMAAADLVICRSGATTLSELQAAAKPAILIPSPNVAENHQYYNAMALVKANAASIIEEKDLTEEKLWGEINRILKGDENLLEKYSKSLKKIAITDSSEKIYRIIKKITGK
jgi:UDP-N-acetylglucosamine--N-acetylmuramyl-(pentapeptide) pyrophosphoryl-undecaprenol N-acetylglucosamine transferase